MAKTLQNHPCMETPPAGVKIAPGSLSASHFTVCQDPQAIPESMESVFKRDYPPWPIDGRPSAADRLQPAKLFGVDDRHFNTRASETTHAYPAYDACKPQLRSDRQKLAATNFKMDADRDKIPAEISTQKAHYTPKVCDRARANPQANLSSIPLHGLRSDAPMSDYKDRFRRFEAEKPEKITPAEGKPTILGDQRQHSYTTTHRKVFEPKTAERLPPLPAPVGSNIPAGDPEKVGTGQTVHQMSYVKHDPNLLKGYNRSDVAGKLQQTHFDQTDGSGRFDNYSTTFKDSYVPLAAPEKNWKMSKHRNHSDLPQGDPKPFIACTTHKVDYVPNRVDKVNLVKGADKRTASNVEFGDPDQMTSFYSTTMRDEFTPKDGVKGSCVMDNSKSSIPIKLYDNSFENGTTYKNDYIEKKQDKLVPNPDALNNLKKTHFDAPLANTREFKTEHREAFVPFAATDNVSVDPTKLQKSSVPLGSLGKTFIQKDNTTYYSDYVNPVRNKFLC